MGGLFSQYLDELEIGDTIDVKGPVGHIVYEGKGHFKINGKPKFVRKISMLAGTPPITPCSTLGS
jgi:nitrate reductase (NAD(P)H)